MSDQPAADPRTPEIPGIGPLAPDAREFDGRTPESQASDARASDAQASGARSSDAQAPDPRTSDAQAAVRGGAEVEEGAVDHDAAPARRRHRAPVPAVVEPARAPHGGAHRAPRTPRSWPGDPAAAWAAAAVADGPELTAGRAARPCPPRLDTLEEVAAHLSPRITGYHLRALVLLLPGLVLGLVLVVRPGRMDALMAQGPTAVAAWVLCLGLVLAAPVCWLVGRALFESRLRAASERALRDGVLCEVLDPGASRPAGSGFEGPQILLETDLDPQRAARIRQALASYARAEGAHRAFEAGPGEVARSVLTSAELFGPQAAGGYLARGAGLEAGAWALVLPAEAPLDPAAPYGDATLIAVTDPPQGSAWDRL
ncbi:hypothetical protein [Brachybacterium phenoliresistens]|uniref:hypothetical protein n=1 Tax=Brachybacterium phenoliresistens TaxID=396014 RepID=UPI0012EBFE2D|nr:hypothetical protein [Brachybacterium phenoliresistens]